MTHYKTPPGWDGFYTIYRPEDDEHYRKGMTTTVDVMEATWFLTLEAATAAMSDIGEGFKIMQYSIVREKLL